MNLLFTAIGGKFKFHVHDSDLEYFLGRFEKYITLSEKKPPLTWVAFFDREYALLLLLLIFIRWQKGFSPTV